MLESDNTWQTNKAGQKIRRYDINNGREKEQSIGIVGSKADRDGISHLSSTMSDHIFWHARTSGAKCRKGLAI